MHLPSGLINPALWAKATRQSPAIQRAARRVARSSRLDPNSWTTLLATATFFKACGEATLSIMYTSLAHIAKRRNRILAASHGSSHPHPPTSAPQALHTYHPEDHLASEWTLAGRTFSCTLRKTGGLAVIELPFVPTTLSTTHTLYTVPHTKTILFLLGPPTHWPDATTPKPKPLS